VAVLPESISIRFGRCEAVIDLDVRDLRVTDQRTAVVKLVFDEDWKLRKILVSDIYVWGGR